MNTNLRLVIAALSVITVFLSSCKKSNNNSPSSSLASCNVDGVSWNSIADSSTAVYVNDELYIPLYSSDGTLISLHIEDTIDGTYTFTIAGASSAEYTVLGLSSDVYSTHINGSGSASITIDHAKRTVSGTFSFLGHNSGNDSVSVTNGKLNAIPFTIDQANSNTIEADLDGSAMSMSSAAATNNSGNGRIELTAMDMTGNSIFVSFPNTAVAGTYAINGTTYIGTYSDALETYVTQSSGATLVISSFDKTNKHVSGTFHFNATPSFNPSVSITNGTFDMDY